MRWHQLICHAHGLRTPNEGINQKNLPMWQTKYASAVPMNLGVGMDFRPCSEGNFLTECPYSVAMLMLKALVFKEEVLSEHYTHLFRSLKLNKIEVTSILKLAELRQCSDQSKELQQFSIYKMHSNFNLEF